MLIVGLIIRDLLSMALQATYTKQRPTERLKKEKEPHPNPFNNDSLNSLGKESLRQTLTVPVPTTPTFSTIFPGSNVIS